MLSTAALGRLLTKKKKNDDAGIKNPRVKNSACLERGRYADRSLDDVGDFFRPTYASWVSYGTVCARDMTRAIPTYRVIYRSSSDTYYRHL